MKTTKVIKIVNDKGIEYTLKVADIVGYDFILSNNKNYYKWPHYIIYTTGENYVVSYADTFKDLQKAFDKYNIKRV